MDVEYVKIALNYPRKCFKSTKTTLPCLVKLTLVLGFPVHLANNQRHSDGWKQQYLRLLKRSDIAQFF